MSVVCSQWHWQYRIHESALWLFMTVSEFAFLWDFQIEIQFNDISLCMCELWVYIFHSEAKCNSQWVRYGHCADTLSQKTSRTENWRRRLQASQTELINDKAYEFSCVVVFVACCMLRNAYGNSMWFSWVHENACRKFLSIQSMQ